MYNKIQLGTLSRIEEVGIDLTLHSIDMGHVASPALGGWKIEWLYKDYQSHVPWSVINPEILQVFFQKEIKVPQMILSDRSMCMIPHQGFVMPSFTTYS